MSSTETTTQVARKRRGSLWRRHRIGSLLLSLILAAFFGALLYVLIGRPVAAPDWVRQKLEARAAAALGPAELRFDDLEFVVEDSIHPKLRMSNVQLLNASGAEIVAFSEMRAGLSVNALLGGRALISDVTVSGIVAQLRRLGDGSVVLSGGFDLAAPSREAATFAQLIKGIDDLLARPQLEHLHTADLRALTLRVEDVRSGKAWTLDGGRMRLTRINDTVQIASDLAVLSGGQNVATLEANYESSLGLPAVEFGATVVDVASGDIAAISPAFAWFDVLRAPISGSVRGGIDADGSVKPVHATFSIGEGVVQPTDATLPIPFSSARSYFTYEPAQGLLSFDELSVDSAWIKGSIEGQVVLGIDDTGQLIDSVGQFTTSTLTANPNNVYDVPVAIDAAEMDFRLTLDPFRLDVGQALFEDKGQAVLAHGSIAAEPDGWRYAMDAHMDGLAPERLLELWPQGAKPKTRKWLSENLLAGQLKDLDLVLRGDPGSAVKTYLSVAFENAEVKYRKFFPTMTDAYGSASLLDNRFVATIDRGQTKAPQGGIVEAGGTSFIIPDVTVKDGPPAVVRLNVSGTVTAGLSLLDLPPLNAMQKADISPAVADGRLQIAGNLSFPVRKGVKPNEVSYAVSGTAQKVTSSTLIADRTIAADSFQIAATHTGIEIAGPGTLDGVPFDVVWTKPIGGGPQPSVVTGKVELSERMIDAFNIGLPPGMVTGQGTGDIVINLPLNRAAPEFSLSTNLRGLRLSSPPLGWGKSSNSVGQLTVDGILGESPRIDRIDLDTPGLSAQGSLSLSPGGGLDRARFSNVAVGNWLRGPVDLVGRGAGRPARIEVRGGTLDLRRADFGGRGSSATGSGSASQIERPLILSLDRLQVTDSIALDEMRGTFDMSSGLDGDFIALVNGGTAVRGEVLPQNGRTAIRITSDDAGGVFASTGILKQARGGDLSLTMLPVGEASFDGTLAVRDTRVKDAPAIAALLSALSIVGLLEQLGGGGIPFREVDAEFRLTPSTMALTRASAVGPSMGLSMDGTYDVTNSTLNMQGVVSPVYLLNSIGSILTRKGEGLIGFNYQLRGPASGPSVSVNPLSALTPGMFREIFRAPPPRVPQVDEAPDRAGSDVSPEAFAPAPEDQNKAERAILERQQRLDER